MRKTANQHDFKGLDKSLRMQKILDTSVDLFHIKGYRSTTLDDVSKEIGITKAALYHYVSSKENLLSKIYIKALESIFENTNKIAEMDLPPDKKLRFIIRNHVKDIIIKSLATFSVFFSEENQLSETDFKKIQEEKKKYNQILENIIEEGMSLGLFRQTDPRLQAYGILGMCNWIYKWYKIDQSPYTPDQIADHFINLLERGYIKNESAENFVEPDMTDGKSIKNVKKSRKRFYHALRAQCQTLIDIIDEKK